MYDQVCNLSVTYTLLPLLDCKMKHTDDAVCYSHLNTRYHDFGCYFNSKIHTL